MHFRGSSRWYLEIVQRLYQKKKSVSKDDDGEILSETEKLLCNVLLQEGRQMEVELASNELPIGSMLAVTEIERGK